MSGVREADLFLLAVRFLLHRADHAAPSPVSGRLEMRAASSLPLTFRVDLSTRAVFVGYVTGVEALTFDDSRSNTEAAAEVIKPTVECLGTVPRTRAWTDEERVFVQTAAEWIHADVTFNASEQTRLLDGDARCFGEVGPANIVAANMALSKSITFGMPHPIVLDYPNRMATWDFDVIPRAEGGALGAAAGADPGVEQRGRGTDVVHVRVGHGEVAASIVRVDTLRHQAIQPTWVRTQICRDETA